MPPEGYCLRCQDIHGEQACGEFQAEREAERREAAINHKCHLCR